VFLTSEVPLYTLQRASLAASGDCLGKGLSTPPTLTITYQPETRNPKPGRGGWDREVNGGAGWFVFKAHRLCVPLNSKLESTKEEEKKKDREVNCGAGERQFP